jgi:hypothetical protein
MRTWLYLAAPSCGGRRDPDRDRVEGAVARAAEPPDGLRIALVAVGVLLIELGKG